MALESPSFSLKATQLSQRILSGEKIPLEELREFIIAANTKLTGDQKKKDTPPKDVDFF